MFMDRVVIQLLKSFKEMLKIPEERLTAPMLLAVVVVGTAGDQVNENGVAPDAEKVAAPLLPPKQVTDCELTKVNVGPTGLLKEVLNVVVQFEPSFTVKL